MTDIDHPAQDTAVGQRKSGKDAAVPEAKALVRVVSRSLWRAELAPKATAEQKKASWTDGRHKYQSSAKRLLKALANNGVTLTMSDPVPRKSKGHADTSE